MSNGFQAWRRIAVGPYSEKEIQQLYGVWLPSGGRKWWQVAESALKTAIEQSKESRARATSIDTLVALVYQDVEIAGGGRKRFAVRFLHERNRWTLASVSERKTTYGYHT